MFANSRPVVLVKAQINRMDGVPDKRNFFLLFLIIWTNLLTHLLSRVFQAKLLPRENAQYWPCVWYTWEFGYFRPKY